MKDKNKTIAGTDINEVKRLNAQSGLSYNEAKKAMAQKKGFLTNKTST
ncbi:MULTISPECIES: hypothetical protein [Evansella]|jgi:hypothetical protein|nr:MULTISPECIES: hypothetical protein [Evansella]UTR08753.1 hypothetical protein MM300_12465 [Evansella sp. LMS18]